MSRIGKQPVLLPSGVEATVADGVVTVKGPKGTLTRELPPRIEVEREVDDPLGPPRQPERVHHVQHRPCTVSVVAHANHCSYQPKRLMRHHRSNE